MFKKSLVALAVAAVSLSAVAETEKALPPLEEMWEVIQQQTAEIKALKAKLNKTDQQLQETEVKVVATAEAVEQQVATPVDSEAQWASKTTLGGYGELHFNNLEGQDGASDKNEIDLHRFVMFFNHEFSDSVRFFSELEVEHSLAGEGKNGEVEVEQAYIEWDLNDNHQAKAGLFLVPVGILNETHEPDTFYGVERNVVEAEIIPTTWWEAGAAINGELAPGWSYDVAVHSGLFLDDTARIRSGRQKVSEAKADNYAYTGRIKYTGIAGLELAATAQYQSNLFQGETFSGASNIDATLFEAHAVYNSGPFGLRALYAHWDIDEGINAVAGRTDADQRTGFYVEPSYRINEKLGVFTRYSQWDEVRSTPGFDPEFKRFDIGLNYWLSETVVLKADYQDEKASAGRDERDGFNLGVGWSY